MQSLRVFQAHYDRVQVECLRRVLVPNLVAVRWKRSLDEKITFHKLSEKRATVPPQFLLKRTRVEESSTNWQSDSETFTTASGHWPVACRNTTSPARHFRVWSRQPSAYFREASDDLERVTPRSRECLCSRSETRTEKPFSRSEMPSEKSVRQTSADIPMPQSSAESLEQVVEDEPRKQRGLSVRRYEPGEWKYEFEMSSPTTTILNLLFTEAEQMVKTRNFRMCIGPGSDGSSADKLSPSLGERCWNMHSMSSTTALLHAAAVPVCSIASTQGGANLAALAKYRSLMHASSSSNSATCNSFCTTSLDFQLCPGGGR